MRNCYRIVHCVTSLPLLTVVFATQTVGCGTGTVGTSKLTDAPPPVLLRRVPASPDAAAGYGIVAWAAYADSSVDGAMSSTQFTLIGEDATGAVRVRFSHGDRGLVYR